MRIEAATATQRERERLEEQTGEWQAPQIRNDSGAFKRRAEYLESGTSKCEPG
jgi:hypothetical protein